MRLVVIACVAALAGATASADDGIHVKVGADQDGPQLTLDPTLRFDPAEGLATFTTDDHTSRFAISPRAHAELEGRVFGDGIPVPDEVPGLGHAGWTAAGRYDVELAWGIHLEVDASLMKLAPQMNGMFGNGMVASYGVALTRYFQWGHGRTAWISLGAEHEDFVGDRVVGVPHGTTVGLRVGTTF